MNDEETLTTQGRLQLAPKQHYTEIVRRSCPYRLQQHKEKLNVKTKQDKSKKFRTLEWHKKCGGVKVLWREHNPLLLFKSGHCGKILHYGHFVTVLQGCTTKGY